MTDIDKSLEWIVPNSQDNIRIYIPGKRKLIVKVSGGADSSIMAYILAKYRHDFNLDLEFIFASSVNQHLPYQFQFAKGVIEYINSVYPLGNYQHVHNMNRGFDFYASDQDLLTNPIHENSSEHILQWAGITANPPMEEMKKNSMFTDLRPDERDRKSIKNITGAEWEEEIGLYKCNYPFVNIDKRGIAELYRYFNVMDDLFPLTRSCEKSTTNFESHCGTCWFCLERQWGFGKLD